MDYKKFLRAGKGASDITPLLKDNEAFNCLINELTKLFKGEEIDKVVCVEGRGFLLGAPVAFNLGVGLVPIRAKGKLKNETFEEKYIDYSGKEKVLEIHRDAILKGDKVIIIDDWLETGATVNAVINLIGRCGGKVIGVGVFMDDSSKDTEESLRKYNYRFLDKVEKGDQF